MLRNFVDWIVWQLRVLPPKAQRLRALVGASPRRRRSVEVFPRMESLEERVVLSHIFYNHITGDQFPILQYSSGSNRTVAFYEDLTGDGFTPDDMPFPSSIPVITTEESLTAGEILTSNGWVPNDAFTRQLNQRVIANGGVLSATIEAQFYDLNKNSGPDFPPYDFFTQTYDWTPTGAGDFWSYDRFTSFHSVTDSVDFSRLFPEGQTWIQTSVHSDYSGDRFTYVREYKVRGMAYEDIDGDGRRDPGEPPYQANVFLDRNKDGILNEPDRDLANNADGTIEVTFRGRGEIGFGFRNLPEYLTVTQGLHQYSAPTLEQGDDVVQDVVFGVFAGSVTGVVFADSNPDGKWHPAQGERGFPGVTVTLEQNGKKKTAISDANGLFLLFAGPGDYRIYQELSEPGVRQTKPTDVKGYTGWMARSGQADQYEFGRFEAVDVAITGAALNGKTAVGFDFTVKGNAGTFTIGVYQSSDTAYQGSDKLLASVIVNPANGQSGHAVLSLPDDYKHSYALPNLLVVADPANKVKEADEKNNLQIVGGGKKDIAIANAVRSGNAVGFDFASVGNTGPYTISVYQSLDTSYQTTDKLVASLIVDPADGQAGHAVLSLPDNYKTDPAKPQLIVMADPGNQIKEENEKNNVQTVRGGNVLLKKANYLGSKDKVQVTTTSAGDETPYVIGLFRSANATYEGNLDKLVTTKTLATAGMQEITFKPPADDPKLPYLIAVLDPQRGIGADAADRIKVVEAPPDVRLSAKLGADGVLRFNTAFVTKLAATSAALAASKKAGVSAAKGGAAGDALEEANQYSVGVYFSADKVFDEGDKLARGLTKITNSHQSGSVDVSDMPPSLDRPYMLAVARLAATTPAHGISDYDLSDNEAIVASWDGPAVLQGALNSAKQSLASAKNKFDKIAAPLYDDLLIAADTAGNTAADVLHLFGQALVGYREKVTESYIDNMATLLQVTDEGRAAFDRVADFIDDKFDTLLKPLLPKSLIDAGTRVSEQVGEFTDQYLRPVAETILDTGYTIITANPIRLELAEKLTFTLEEKLRTFSLDPITGTQEFAGDVAQYAGDLVGMVKGVIAAPFRGFYYMAHDYDKVLPALGHLFNKTGTVANAAGEYINAHPDEVRQKMINGIADYFTSAMGIVDLLLLPMAAEKFAPRIWSAAAAAAESSPSVKAALKFYSSADASFQKAIKPIEDFAKSATPSLAKFSPSERQVSKFARVLKASEESKAVTKAEVLIKANNHELTVAEREGYQKLHNLLESADETGLISGRDALAQLPDTKLSRTAKQLETTEQAKLIRSRAERVYATPDRSTLGAVEDLLTSGSKPNPAQAEADAIKALLGNNADQKTVTEIREWIAKNKNKLSEGWELKMDTFSTPKKGAVIEKIGADRDARAVFQRVIGFAEDGAPIVERLEVPLKFWEKRAYADFRAHGIDLYGGAMPEDVAKLVNKKVEELQYLKGGPNGLTDQQVLDRAFAEHHNQLFTDRLHMEASAANSDQLNAIYSEYLKEIPEGALPLPKQTFANVVATKDGNALLRDPDGYALMWREKVRFYTHDPAEAIAQAQKGIRDYLDIRKAYSKKMNIKDAAGRAYNVKDAEGIVHTDLVLKLPDIPEKTRSMMSIILDAPTGVAATDARITEITRHLQAYGARDLQTALQEVVGNVASLKTFKLPSGYSFVNPGIVTP